MTDLQLQKLDRFDGICESTPESGRFVLREEVDALLTQLNREHEEQKEEIARLNGDKGELVERLAGAEEQAEKAEQQLGKMMKMLHGRGARK